MVHPLTGILVGTKMNNSNKTNTQNSNTNTYQNYEKFIKSLKKEDSFNSRFKYARKLLKLIEANKQNGCSHENDETRAATLQTIIDDYIYYIEFMQGKEQAERIVTSIKEDRNGLKSRRRRGKQKGKDQTTALINQTKKDEAPQQNAEVELKKSQEITKTDKIIDLLKDKLCMTLVNTKNILLKPVDVINEWPKVEIRMSYRLRRHLQEKTGSIPRYDSSEIYRGFLLIRCKDKASKEFLHRCIAVYKNSFKKMTLDVLPAAQLAFLFNKSWLRDDFIEINPQSTTSNRPTKSKPTFNANEGFQLSKNYFETDCDMTISKQTPEVPKSPAWPHSENMRSPPPTTSLDGHIQPEELLFQRRTAKTCEENWRELNFNHKRRKSPDPNYDEKRAKTVAENSQINMPERRFSSNSASDPEQMNVLRKRLIPGNMMPNRFSDYIESKEFIRDPKQMDVLWKRLAPENMMSNRSLDYNESEEFMPGHKKIDVLRKRLIPENMMPNRFLDYNVSEEFMRDHKQMDVLRKRLALENMMSNRSLDYNESKEFIRERKQMDELRKRLVPGNMMSNRYLDYNESKEFMLNRQQFNSQGRSFAQMEKMDKFPQHFYENYGKDSLEESNRFSSNCEMPFSQLQQRNSLSRTQSSWNNQQNFSEYSSNFSSTSRNLQNPIYQNVYERLPPQQQHHLQRNNQEQDSHSGYWITGSGNCFIDN